MPRIAPKYRHAADIPATVRGKISRSGGSLLRFPEFQQSGECPQDYLPKARSVVLEPPKSQWPEGQM